MCRQSPDGSTLQQDAEPDLLGLAPLVIIKLILYSAYSQCRVYVTKLCC